MSFFHFKYFSIQQANSAMKVGTDALLLGSFIEISNRDIPKKALDIGTGTGVLSLMLAQRFSVIEIDAIDIDTESALEATLNFENSPWNSRLKCNCSSLQEWHSAERYDLIVSNPPFYTSHNPNTDIRKANARHALGLPIHVFSENIKRLLSPSGELWIIVPFEDRFLWSNQLNESGLHVYRDIEICGKETLAPNRSILAFSFLKRDIQKDEMTVRQLNGSYTEAYVQLTAEFHDRKLTS
jgi:tRNA1Val (adenine37-N6)-methyltransferase